MRRRATGRWWWRPRARSALLLGVLGLVALLARIVAQFQTEWLWFNEVGQARVFWTMVASKWLAGSLAGLGTAMFLLANFWVVERTAPRDARLPRDQRSTARLRRVLLPAYLALSVGAGLAVGHSVVHADWQQLILWLHRSDFGLTDPLFHRDVGFFVFSLPLYQKVAHWLFLTVAIGLASTFAAHAATGAIRVKPAPVSATRAAHAHLLALGALLLLVTAWQHRLGQFALALPRPGAKLPGAGYTDVHVVLPWLRVLVVVSFVAAAMLLYGAVRRSWAIPAVALVVVIFAELANPAILPSVVQRFFVDPQTLSRERPYIANSVRFTQLAYGLHRVADRPLPANATISAAELRANRDVLRNIQLWDTDVLRPQIDQQQSIGSYYAFPNTTVDRYRQAGEARAMIVAQRELDLRRLEKSGRTWANDRLAYTHGYGLVAVPAGGVGPAGQPKFVTSEFGAGRAPTKVRQPRIYYGVQPRGAAAVGDRQDKAARDREAASGRRSRAGIPLRRRRRDLPRESAAARDVRPSVRRAEPRAVPDDHRAVAHHPAPRRRGQTAHAGAVPALGEASRGGRRRRAHPVPGAWLHHEQLLPVLGAGRGRREAGQLHARGGGGDRGRVQRPGDPVRHRRRRPDPARLARGLPRRCSHPRTGCRPP